MEECKGNCISRTLGIEWILPPWSVTFLNPPDAILVEFCTWIAILAGNKERCEGDRGVPKLPSDLDKPLYELCICQPWSTLCIPSWDVVWCSSVSFRTKIKKNQIPQGKYVYGKFLISNFLISKFFGNVSSFQSTSCPKPFTIRRLGNISTENHKLHPPKKIICLFLA